MRTLILHALLLFSCLPVCSQELSKNLYTFDFTLEKLSINERTKLVNDLGFKGMTFEVRTDEQVKKLQDYLATPEFTSGNLTIPVTYYYHEFNRNSEMGDNPRWKQVLNILPEDTDFWLLIGKESAPRESIKSFIKEVADEARKSNKNVVLYPHDGHSIETAEYAVSFIKELELNNVYVTVHLCHEFRAGNGSRMKEVLENVKPYLKYVSISGALETPNPNGGSWNDAIRPLDDSPYDIEGYIGILNDINYDGKVFLHTFGIQQRPPEDHMAASIQVWNDLVAQINVLSTDNLQEVSDQNFTISPVPAIEDITVRTTSPTSINFNFHISNLMGQSVLTGTLLESKQTIPIAQLDSGVYILSVFAKKKNIRKIFIKY